MYHLPTGHDTIWTCHRLGEPTTADKAASAAAVHTADAKPPSGVAWLPSEAPGYLQHSQCHLGSSSSAARNADVPSFME